MEVTYVGKQLFVLKGTQGKANKMLYGTSHSHSCGEIWLFLPEISCESECIRECFTSVKNEGGKEQII